ncbi:MAG: homoserine kinase [Candidatus Micrarchaeota archaeon]|nr:homoserine kinase [Candidatus Micrarchaeota archaeon]
MDSVRIRAPATTANLGAGFDVCGMALLEPSDHYVFQKADAWSVVNQTPLLAATDSEKSVFAFVWKAMREKFGLSGSLAIAAEKGVKPSAGMGSSACEASATALAVNELFKLGLSREELVYCAGTGEAFAAGQPHYDNVAPCVLGGFTITYGTDPLQVKRLDAPDLALLLVRSDKTKPSTAFARGVLPQTVPRADALANTFTLAKLLVGFFESNSTLVANALDDRIVEPARSNAGILPHLMELKELAATHGFGAAASGAGPTLICVGTKKSADLEQTVRALYDAKGIKTDLLWTQPSQAGVCVA